MKRAVMVLLAGVAPMMPVVGRGTGRRIDSPRCQLRRIA
jgi:hypothetical protein